jgi:tetratricopeptide (TPR) repeat protein
MASRQERKFAFSYLERGKQFATAKQYPEALEALREAVRRDPSRVEAWILLASVHYALGEDIECLGATEEALKHNAISGAAWNYRGLALERLRCEEEALDAYARAMRVDGWFLIAGQNAFGTLTRAERYEDALRVADALLAGQKDDGLFWAMRSAALRCLQQYEQAYHAASTAVKFSPENGQAWFQLAATFSRLRRYSEAFQASERELALRGASLDFWWLRASILGGQRRFEEALAASQEALALDSKSVISLNQAGLALLHLGRPAEAYMRFVQAAALKTQSPVLLNNIGVALAHLRRFENALAWIEKALSLDPCYWVAANNRIDTLIQLFRYDEAQVQLMGAAEDATGLSSYWSAKGLLHTRRGEYDEALAAIRRAVDLSDDDSNTAVAWERMGELLIALEDYSKALEVAGHGLTIRPHDFCLQELKAKALRGTGRESEAEEIERAVQTRLAEQLALLDQMDGAGE